MPLNLPMDSDSLNEKLRAVRDKRGYLLPHHGLMAITSPELLEAYDRTYTALALEERAMSRLDHETVWLATLIACEEALATHHIRRFEDAGGSRERFRQVQALTAFAMGVNAYQFVGKHWSSHLPEANPRAEYLESFQSASGTLPFALAHTCAAAIMTCLGNWQALEWHISAFYAAVGEEAVLAEALSLAMFPGSVPNFVEAAGVWREMIVSQKVIASATFKTWAELSGQGGYDEASGVKE